MARKRFDDSSCSVARALNEVGDWWSLLIVLHAMYGTRQFVDFQQQLGIAKTSCATAWPSWWITKCCARRRGRARLHFEYRLTEKGRDLFPVVVALRQWGDKWNPAPDGQPLDLRDRETGQPIKAVTVQNAEGEPLSIRDVLVVEDLEKASNQG